MREVLQALLPTTAQATTPILPDRNTSHPSVSRLSRTWRDRLLGAGAGAAFTLVILWLVLVSTAAAAVILRA